MFLFTYLIKIIDLTHRILLLFCVIFYFFLYLILIDISSLLAFSLIIINKSLVLESPILEMTNYVVIHGSLM